MASPVNPPSPAFRGVRGLRLTQSRVIGPLAPLLGLRSRRKMTSLNRPAPRSPHARCMRFLLLHALRRVAWRFARGVFEGCFRF